MASHFNLRLVLVALCLVLCANAKRTRPPKAPSPSNAPRMSFADLLPIVEKQLENPDDEDTKTFMTLDAAKTLDSADEDPEVRRVCGLTDYPLLCAAGVIPSLKGKATVDTIFEAAIKAGTAVAKKAKKLAKEIAAKPDTPPEILTTVKDCKDSYSTTIENYEKSMTAASEHDIGTIRSMLSGALTYLGQCQEDIAQVQTGSPLQDYAQRLTDMTSNCLAIAGLMT